jgi:hypothetical protein
MTDNAASVWGGAARAAGGADAVSAEGPGLRGGGLVRIGEAGGASLPLDASDAGRLGGCGTTVDPSGGVALAVD